MEIADLAIRSVISGARLLSPIKEEAQVTILLMDRSVTVRFRPALPTFFRALSQAF